MFRQMVGFCGKTPFARDAEEEFLWLMRETSGHAANAV